MKAKAFAGVLLTGIIVTTGCTQPGGCSRPVVRQSFRQAPDFRLPALQDPSRLVSLSEWTEKGPVLLTFWATWCPPCVREITELNAIAGRFPQQELKILGVNVGESVEVLKKFAALNTMNYEVLMDAKGTVAGQYGIDGLPVAVLLAKGGGILYYGFTLPKPEDFLSQSS